jgi:uncharacterized membrane protein
MSHEEKRRMSVHQPLPQSTKPPSKMTGASTHNRRPGRRWTAGRKTARAVQITSGFLITIVLASFVKRLIIDMPHITAGTLPADAFDRRYVTHPWLAYLHITPGVLYLLLAILQLSYRFRSRHYVTHRRLGRIAAGAAMASGVFAVIFGGLFAFGGTAEGSAAVVFSLWLLVCVVVAVRAIRRGDMVRHRRWMIRAFAIGVGVGTVRIWLVLFEGLGVLDFKAAFGPAFWIGFSMHAVAAELWLRARPDPPEMAEPRQSDSPAEIASPTLA